MRKDVAPDNLKSKEKDKEKGSKKQLDSKPDEKSELVNQEMTTAAEKYWPVRNTAYHIMNETHFIVSSSAAQRRHHRHRQYHNQNEL